MTIFSIIDAFTYYGLDVMLLASLTALTVQIFKITFLKRLQKKLLTFLPFAVGTLYYAVYATLVRWDISYPLTGYIEILEHGISVGASATLVYVLYEQFVRAKKASSPAESVISTLIEGYVPSELLENTAKSIAQAIEKDVTGNGAKRACEILSENTGESVTQNDILLLSRLIVETLAHINV